MPASSLPRKHPYTHVTHHACSPAWQAARPPGFSDARPPARASLAGGELQGPVHRSAERVPDLGPASPCSAPRSMLRVCLCLLLPASPVLPAPHPGMPAALQPGTASRLLAPNQAPFIGPSPAFTIENRTPAPSHSGNWNAGDAGMASPALTGRGGVSVCMSGRAWSQPNLARFKSPVTTKQAGNLSGAQYPHLYHRDDSVNPSTR